MLSRREMGVLCTSLLFCLLLSLGAGWAQSQLTTADQLAADTLRLHIRADSDTLQDQTDKLAVRDAVLAYMDTRCRAATQPEALRWAAAHLPELEWTARRTLALRGSRADVTVKLVEMYFDTTRYPTGILPAGRYQALRIDLGGGRGRNWWCVLYPGLCRSVCGGYAQPAENDLVCGEYILRFRCVEWWQGLTADRRDKILLSGIR